MNVTTIYYQICKTEQIQQPDREYNLEGTPSLRGRYALPTLMTPPRPSSGFTEGYDLAKRVEYNDDVAKRRAEISIVHLEDKWKGKNRKLGNRDIDDTLRIEVRALRKQRLKALYSPNWGVNGNNIPTELEDVCCRKTRPQRPPTFAGKKKEEGLMAGDAHIALTITLNTMTHKSFFHQKCIREVTLDRLKQRQ